MWHAYRTEVRAVAALRRLCGNAEGATRASPAANNRGGVCSANTMCGCGLLAMGNSNAVGRRSHINGLITKRMSAMRDERGERRKLWHWQDQKIFVSGY